MDEGVDDAELVARVAHARTATGHESLVSRNGEPAGEEALRTLLDRHGPSVMALALRTLGTREEAEEVVQDTFFRLYLNADGFRPETASLRTWLFAIARNLATSRLRKRYARPQAASGIDPHGVVFQNVVGGRKDPLPRILVRDALARLDPDERRLLEGAFYEGFSHSELAREHDLPLGTVKSKIRRALLKLRTSLEEGVA